MQYPLGSLRGDVRKETFAVLAPLLAARALLVLR
jgi:hypothetical protein